MADFEKKVLELVARDDYSPSTLKALSRRLAVSVEDYAEFRATVKRMVREGVLGVGRAKTLGKPDAAPDTKGLIVGTFRRTSKGFGFVRPKGNKGGDRSGDIYIPIDKGRDASSGDEVAVRILKKPHAPGMNIQGEVVQVVARAAGLFVGSYYEEDGQGYVKVDGTTFHGPISVGDPGAKGAKLGDKVAIEMVRYPRPDSEGTGVITEILGERGQPGVDTLTIIRAFGIPDTFDDETLNDAREQARDFNPEDLEKRVDLRDSLTVTIDPANARDFDDAITLTRDENGFWSLGVHIADVSHFVRPGSPLDLTARKRGTSVYLPDRVIPMLPEVLSNSLASLQQGQTRFTMTAMLEFNEEGVRTDRRFARTAIRVDKRFSYEQAYAVMQGTPEGLALDVAPEVRDLLKRMLTLAMILRKRRFKRGALELNMPEVEVDLGDKGEVVGAHLNLDDPSHQVIEEFMLAANEAVAELLTEKHVGFLRRVHPDPEPTKLRQFGEFARSLGIAMDSPQSRFELQRVLKQTADLPERHAIHYALLRSLKQATYTPESEGHYALASDDYCHFTSPIRRYPDLQVHRQLGALLDNRPPRSDPDELADLAEHCTRTERRSEAAERELIKVKLLTFLEDKIGTAFHAVIIGVEDFGVFCQLVEFPVEGLLRITAMGDDHYYLEAGTHSLVGRRSGKRFRLGDQLEVRVARVDVDRRELDLVPADFSGALVQPPPRARAADVAKGPANPRSKARGDRSRPARPEPRAKSKGKSKKSRKRKP